MSIKINDICIARDALKDIFEELKDIAPSNILFETSSPPIPLLDLQQESFVKPSAQAKPKISGIH